MNELMKMAATRGLRKRRMALLARLLGGGATDLLLMTLRPRNDWLAHSPPFMNEVQSMRCDEHHTWSVARALGRATHVWPGLLVAALGIR